MKLQKLQFVVAGILVLVSGAALADQGGVKYSMKEGAGSYLSDANGKTLYRYGKDSTGKSACAGTCLEKWPVYYRATPAAGVNASDYSVITRQDGKKQSTFRGYPLYYYSGDKKAGDAKGQGVGGDWFVIDPKSTSSGTEMNKGTTTGTDMNKGSTMGNHLNGSTNRGTDMNMNKDTNMGTDMYKGTNTDMHKGTNTGTDMYKGTNTDMHKGTNTGTDPHQGTSGTPTKKY